MKTTNTAAVNGQRIAYDISGNGPPVLLLHGFPQNRDMWRDIALELSLKFTVVAADLRGYGDSSCPEHMQDMSFRNMAADMVALMDVLGFPRFHAVGHDRGARTVHRLALDAPEAVVSLTVMDIVPTHFLLDGLTQDVARAYYHWFFLAQPTPFPESLIGHDPDAYFESCLLGFGKAALSDFESELLDSYRKTWRNPASIHAMCNDYRAAIDVDFHHDAADLHRNVSCPSLVLFGADGAMAKVFDIPATWRPRLANMQSAAIPGGHFFPDQSPQETTLALNAFLAENG